MPPPISAETPRTVTGLLIGLAVLLLGACLPDEQQTVRPLPQEPGRDAIGHYCSMIVVDHSGPKAQIHLTSDTKPIWFSSVRDGIAFTLLPEEPKDVAAIYVNDMGQGGWEQPAAASWIDATEAWYVIGSRRRGGMGAPEAVPFAEAVAAEAFAAAEGGSVVAYADIPPDYILTPPEEDPAMPHHGQHGQQAKGMEMEMKQHGDHTGHATEPEQ